MASKKRKSLKDKLKVLPSKPGIYLFKNSQGSVLYIGKARSLKDRVKSYFQATAEAKVKNILAETADLDFILTDSAKEASFLENNLIRRYQPKFNLRLKDDKSFPYLKLTLQEKFPGIYLTRRVEEDGAKYFGPFSPAHQARKTIHLLNKYFGLRSCEEQVPGKRKRPCLEYDLNLCAAPCVGYITEANYRQRVDSALLFLEGKTERLLVSLRQKMKEAADNQEFEQAAQWRDLIWTIEEIKRKPKLISVALEDKDIFGFSRKGEKAAVYVFQMRKGRVIDSASIFLFKKASIADSKILADQIIDFYREKEDIPQKILLPFAPQAQNKLLEEISKLSPRKINFILPQRGKNKKLVELANKNAQIIIKRKFEEKPLLEEVRDVLGLEKRPKRIEGFDISNIGGQESVGSLVVFENGHPQKNDYRKYKIKTVAGPNDIASLEEVLRRRYSRLIQKKQPLPDLILIDGGKGQLNAASRVLKEFGLEKLPVISIAKKEEIIFTSSQKQGLKLERTSRVLKLIQSIRDEAHRFAISFHRLRRRKKSFESPLDGLPGIGAKRKARLLGQYKNIEEIKKAPIEELTKLIGRHPAQILKERLIKEGKL